MSSDRLERIENKLDKVVDGIGVINVTLARNTSSLEEHVKRTNMLEEKINPVWLSFKSVGFFIGALTIISTIVGIASYFRQ